jgi:hypothetical protein
MEQLNVIREKSKQGWPEGTTHRQENSESKAVLMEQLKVIRDKYKLGCPDGTTQRH